jgi:hypothetical protein
MITGQVLQPACRKGANMGGTKKVYSGDRTIDGVVVQVDGKKFRASERQDRSFEWGYEGASPLELSRALLIDHLGDTRQAEILATSFMREVVANFANEWQMTSEDIDLALNVISVQPSIA